MTNVSPALCARRSSREAAPNFAFLNPSCAAGTDAPCVYRRHVGTRIIHQPPSGSRREFRHEEEKIGNRQKAWEKIKDLASRDDGRWHRGAKPWRTRQPGRAHQEKGSGRGLRQEKAEEIIAPAEASMLWAKGRNTPFGVPRPRVHNPKTSTRSPPRHCRSHGFAFGAPSAGLSGNPC